MKRILLFSFLLLLAMVPSGLAQSPTGIIRGTVEDTTGAAVPGATVTITNINTNETQTTKSDGAGRYIFPLVQPSTYTVTVKAAGFQSEEQQNVIVRVAVGSPVNFQLPVANVSQTVKVTSTTPALQTTSGTLSTTVNNTLINDIPLNGRNPTSLEVLVPGVSTLGGASTPHIAGSRNANNEEQIDGMTNILPENNVGNNSTAYTPIPDSLQEFNVQTSVLPAQYGRFSGGTISMVTKSGTNHFHGTVFDFSQTNALYARPYFSSGPVPSSHLYQFGGTIGGPLVIPHVYDGHNKTFFFFAWEMERQAAVQSELDTVPTAAERNGDFSQSGETIYNPYTATLQTSGPDAGEYVRQPFANNQIPSNLMSTVAKNAIQYYPMPNTGGNGTIFNNYTATGPSTNNYYQYTIRLDHQFSSRWHSFVRYTYFHNPNVPFSDYNNAASPGNYNGPGTGTATSLSFDNEITFTPTLVGDLRIGFSRSTELRTAFGQPFNVASLGFPASYTNLVNKQLDVFPTFQLSNGYSSLGSTGYAPLQEDPSAVDFNPSFVKQIGGNSITFGGEWRKLFLNFYQYAYPAGDFGGIDQTWTQQVVNQSNGSGNPVATMLLGLADYGYITHDISLATSSGYGALFIQDDYQARPNLTFNLGLRWDVEIPRTERHNRLDYWDPTLPSPIANQVPATACLYCADLKGQMVFVGTKNAKWGRHQGPTQWHDFAPRVGFAWSPDEKTVVRGGYGVVFQPSEMQAAGTTGGSGTDGFTGQTNFNFTLDNQQTVATTFDNPAPNGFSLPQGVAGGPGTFLGLGISDTFFDTYDNPYSIQGNLSIQRQLPGNIVLTAGYIYNRGVHLINGDPGVPFSQVNPKYLSLGNQLLKNVPNPFYGIITTPGSPLAAQTVPYNYLLRPFPQYNGVSSYRKADSGSHYNAFTLKLDKRFSHGLTFLVSYTGSKLMDNAAGVVNYLGPSSQTYANQYNPKAEFGLSAADQSKLFSTGYAWELPIGQGHEFLSNLHGVANELVSGWQTNGIIQFTSGTPVVLGAVNNETGLLGFGQRPDEAPGDPNISNRSRKHWFNTKLFSQPAPFTIGNAPRVLPNVRNPAYFDADMSAFKNNYFGRDQRYNVQFRLEAFNALNHPNFGSPDANVNDGTFGQVNSSAGSPRQIQLAVKFIY